MDPKAFRVYLVFNGQGWWDGRVKTYDKRKVPQASYWGTELEISGTSPHRVEETDAVRERGERSQGEEVSSRKGKEVLVGSALRRNHGDFGETIVIQRRQELWDDDSRRTTIVGIQQRFWKNDGDAGKKTIPGKQRGFWENDGDSGKTTAIPGKRPRFWENDGDSGKTTATPGKRHIQILIQRKLDNFKWTLTTIRFTWIHDFSKWRGELRIRRTRRRIF